MKNVMSVIRLNAKYNIGIYKYYIGIYNVSYHYISMNVSVCPHCDRILLQGPSVSPISPSASWPRHHSHRCSLHART